MHASDEPVDQPDASPLSLPLPGAAAAADRTGRASDSEPAAAHIAGAMTQRTPYGTGAAAVTSGSGAFGFSFTQGILLGQASMVVLAVLFLRYVVFEDPTISKRVNEERRQKRKRARSRSLAGASGDGSAGTAGARRSLGKDAKGKGKGPVSAGEPGTSTAPSATALLDSLGYDLSSHAPESLDWLNVLLGQLIGSYRYLAASHSEGGARALLEEALNRSTLAAEAEGREQAQGMIGLDFIEVDEVELGEAFPVLTDARIRPSGSEIDSVRIELDIDYSDRVVLAVSTRVVLNVPRPRFAILPVSLSVSLERFSGTLTVEIPPHLVPPHVGASGAAYPSDPSDPSDPHPAAHAHPTVHLSLQPDFDLSLSTSSLLGSRAKLQDVPKVEQLLVARIRAVIQDRVVWPGRVEVALPSLDRRKHHHHHRHHGHEESLLAGEVPVQQPDGLYQDVDGTSPLSPLSPPFEQHSPPSVPSPVGEEDAEEQAPDIAARLRPPFRPPFLSGASTSRTSSTTPETPSISLSEAGGPSIALHPKIHPPTPGGRGLTAEALAAASASPAAATPSPTETLPGYFATKLGRSGVGLYPGKSRATGAATGRSTSGLGAGGGGMRQRPPAGSGGGGLGLV